MSLAIIHRINQEPGAMPGAGLKPLTAIAYFVGGPLILFLAITGIVLLSTAVKKKSSGISQIN
ncbi:MAG: hypothetical protein NTZ31_04325 [Actinobacteria bacterium]|jgi:Ni,Fe-hydrogenase I cytochrome b subunit|nr:hypothetical protein [Actinomycetota bacterium]